MKNYDHIINSLRDRGESLPIEIIHPDDLDDSSPFLSSLQNHPRACLLGITYLDIDRAFRGPYLDMYRPDGQVVSRRSLGQDWLNNLLDDLSMTKARTVIRKTV